MSSVVLAGDNTGSSRVNCGSVEIPALPPLPCAVLFAVPGMPARSFTGPMSAVAEAGMAPSYNVRDTTARDGLIGDSRLNPFPRTARSRAGKD
ncbi:MULTISPECIES: hypothetical protein [Bacteroidales]|uniref:Uncharacterized protein n=5 Tax=Bacteroidia TaxID=200643 RepID=A0AAW8VAW5_9BACE|nr:MULTISPECIES: hypothetical protein [Bacteroidales]MBM6493926.1 hypothetical protein [Phocaeicola dorei]MBT8724992.1 hypothetical protein [Bacteroides uniformis]MCE9048217.1 hypothetical protein [Bacteroides fragilis]MBS5758663.1 hypothetical protein [Bacteroides sp.]MBS5767192.1 hypothetical protein [Bacteroides sp.]